MFNTAKTQIVLSKLPSFLKGLLDELPRPVRVPEPKGGFHWEFPEQSARVVVVCKLARSVSAITAAWELCDRGFLAEASSLLRMTSDYAQEVIALGEGLRSGSFTTAQKRFVEQYFAPMPRTPEEFEQQERRPYIGREEHIKSEARLLAESGMDAQASTRIRRFLNRGYDGYVHGDYLTAMQLYNGQTLEFEVTGDTDNLRGTEATRLGVAGKLHEVLVAFEFSAHVFGNHQLADAVREARDIIAPFTT